MLYYTTLVYTWKTEGMVSSNSRLFKQYYFNSVPPTSHSRSMVSFFRLIARISVLPDFPEPYALESPWEITTSWVFEGFLEKKVLENEVKSVWYGLSELGSRVWVGSGSALSTGASAWVEHYNKYGSSIAWIREEHWERHAERARPPRRQAYISATRLFLSQRMS